MGDYDEDKVPSVPPEVWRPAARIRRALVGPIESFLKIEAAAGALLFFMAILALAWANSPWAHAYEALWHTPLGFVVGPFSFSEDLHFWVNDGLMAVFFFVLGLEIKREMAVGELSSFRRALLPLAVALGGMVVPAAIYVALNAGTSTVAGWGVPIATDLAFALGILSLLGKRVPPVLRVVLLAAAIIDDLGSIIVIAVFYTDQLHVDGLFIAILAASVMVGFSKAGLRSAWYFVIPAVVVWAGVMRFGVHPVSAGVLLGLLVPHRSWFGAQGFVNEAQLALDEAKHALAGAPNAPPLERQVARVSLAAQEAEPPVERLLHGFHPITAFFIMPLFALANAGVTFGGLDWPEGSARVSWSVGLGLVAGKPIGMLLFAFLAVKLNMCSMPKGVSFREFSVMGLVAGIGFTMSMFIAELAFGDTGYIGPAKIGILLSSVAAAVATLLWGIFVLPKHVSPEASPTATEAEQEEVLPAASAGG